MNVDNIDKLSNEDLGKIIKKYNINTNGITLNRSNAVTLVKNFIIQKQSEKNVKNISVNNQKNRQRRMSSANATSRKRTAQTTTTDSKTNAKAPARKKTKANVSKCKQTIINQKKRLQKEKTARPYQNKIKQTITYRHK